MTCQCHHHRRYRAVDVARIAQVTYRQLDHWLRLGIVTTRHEPQPGSGFARAFTRREALLTACVADLMLVSRDSAAARRLWLALDEVGSIDDWPEVLVVDDEGVHRPTSDRSGVYLAIGATVGRVLAETRGVVECEWAVA